MVRERLAQAATREKRLAGEPAESSEARNTATGPISSGCPVRPSGVIETNCFSKSHPINPAALVPSVSTMPGLIEFTRIFRGPSSLESTGDAASTAPFVAV